MNSADRIWQRLARAARTAPVNPSDTAPMGFATRVVARWRTEPAPSLLPVWEWLSARALAVGCLLMLLSLVGGFSMSSENNHDVTSLPDQMIQQVLNP